MSVEVARFGMRGSQKTNLIPDVCSCHVLRILAAAVCKICDVCCLLAAAHQPFSSNSLGLGAPEDACSRNLRTSNTLKLGYEGIFKIVNSPGFITEICHPKVHCSIMLSSLNG